VLGVGSMMTPSIQRPSRLVAISIRRRISMAGL
jgi:hypothetical protein